MKCPHINPQLHPSICDISPFTLTSLHPFVHSSIWQFLYSPTHLPTQVTSSCFLLIPYRRTFAGRASSTSSGWCGRKSPPPLSCTGVNSAWVAESWHASLGVENLSPPTPAQLPRVCSSPMMTLVWWVLNTLRVLLLLLFFLPPHLL